MKKQIKTKIKPVPVEETAIGELVTPHEDSEYCTCIFQRTKDKYFDDEEKGRANVQRIKLCQNCISKAGILRVDPEFMLAGYYMSYGSMVIRL